MIQLILIIALMLASCTDTDKASLSSIGSSGEITCYSGGKVILKTKSTGRIQTVEGSDGWEFKDAASGRFIRVSGTCVIEN